MDVKELGIRGAFLFTPAIHADERGSFLETFRADDFEKATGHALPVAQANTSVSAAGTIRGIHFAELPPSQAKYVTCPKGAILDIVVDLRVGSPTYGKWEAVLLDDRRRQALYLSEALGHGFMALEDDTVVNYLCSAPYAPGREHGVNPFDSTLGIEWPAADRSGAPLRHRLSPKDSTAPSLSEIEDAGLLASFEEAQDWLDSLRGRG